MSVKISNELFDELINTLPENCEVCPICWHTENKCNERKRDGSCYCPYIQIFDKLMESKKSV